MAEPVAGHRCPNDTGAVLPKILIQILNPEGMDKFKYKCCTFKKSYFYRTVIQWNLLPLNMRTLENVDKFEIGLKEHMWLILGLEPD